MHEEKQKSLEEVTVKRAMEDVEIQDDGETEGGGDVFAAYYAEGSGEKQADRPVVFMPEMGLAMEVGVGAGSVAAVLVWQGNCLCSRRRTSHSGWERRLR